MGVRAGEKLRGEVNVRTINPLLVQATAGAKPTTTTIAQATGARITERKTRSDKMVDIKFPVTREQRRELRTLAIGRKLGDRQTFFNTKLLQTAIANAGHCAELDYKDSGQYMHVKPTQVANEEIEKLMLDWGCSKRQAVHRLMINAMQRNRR